MELSRARAAVTVGAMAVDEAEERLAEAEVRLQLARFDALLGNGYDADTFDRLIVRYRAAKRTADALRDRSRCSRPVAAPAVLRAAHPFGAAGVAGAAS